MSKMFDKGPSFCFIRCRKLSEKKICKIFPFFIIKIEQSLNRKSETRFSPNECYQ